MIQGSVELRSIDVDVNLAVTLVGHSVWSDIIWWLSAFSRAGPWRSRGVVSPWCWRFCRSHDNDVRRPRRYVWSVSVAVAGGRGYGLVVACLYRSTAWMDWLPRWTACARSRGPSPPPVDMDMVTVYSPNSTQPIVNKSVPIQLAQCWFLALAI